MLAGVDRNDVAICVGIDFSVLSSMTRLPDHGVQPLRRVSDKVAVLMHRAALNRHAGPERGERLLEARRAVDNDELGPAQARAVRSSRSTRQAASLSPPMFLTASSNFCPSSRTPSATSSEIVVAFLSSRTRTTVPSRIHRTIGSSARERAFHASQSPFTLRQVRLTTSVAHGVFENRRKRQAHPARVGPRQVGASDQCVGGLGAALIGPQRLALPLARLAVLANDPGARHGDLGFSKRAVSVRLR